MTNNVRWLPSMDKIIVMNNGEVAETGTFEELMTHAGTFAQFLKAYLLQGETTSEEENDEEEGKIQCVAKVLEPFLKITQKMRLFF